MNEQSELLKAIYHLLGRMAFDNLKLKKIVAPKRNMQQNIKIYNSCDGTKTQNDLAKLFKTDAGNLSRRINKWVAEGILLRIKENNEVKLLHLYPLTFNDDDEK